MPIRNPFARRPGVAGPQDELLQPGSDIAHPGFERVDTVGSKASSALSVGSRRSQDTGEYKMSVVNDSGVYLPPSPTERETSWPKRYLTTSRTSMETRSSFGDIEHFSISRESFDSYRRSFDISARSPIVTADPAPRQSLDSARFPRHPRSALAERRFERREPATTEEEFEDVGLSDDGRPHHLQQSPAAAPSAPQQRKRGFLSKFTTTAAADSATVQDPASPSSPSPATAAQGPMSMARFLPGRKRAQSGQGAELGAMPAADGQKSSLSVVEAQEVKS